MESIDNYVKHGKNAVPIAVFLYLYLDCNGSLTVTEQRFTCKLVGSKPTYLTYVIFAITYTYTACVRYFAVR